MSAKSPRPPSAVTAAEVVATFEREGGRGPFPDAGMVRSLVRYMNLVGIPPPYLRPEWDQQREDQAARERFRDALQTIAVDGPRVVAAERREIAKIKTRPDEIAKHHSRMDEIQKHIDGAENLLERFPPHSPSPRFAPWHTVACEIADRVRAAFAAAGRRGLSVGKPTSPIVQVVTALLARLEGGDPKNPEAVAKALTRAGRGDNPKMQLGDAGEA
jgi:hypothetical protein